MKNQKKKSHSLRLNAELGQHIEEAARQGRRSFTAEAVLLMEQGIEWRKKYGNKIPDSNSYAH